jgi:hypothetical protein
MKDLIGSHIDRQTEERTIACRHTLLQIRNDSSFSHTSQCCIKHLPQGISGRLHSSHHHDSRSWTITVRSSCHAAHQIRATIDPLYIFMRSCCRVMFGLTDGDSRGKLKTNRGPRHKVCLFGYISRKLAGFTRWLGADAEA